MSKYSCNINVPSITCLQKVVKQLDGKAQADARVMLTGDWSMYL